MEMFNDKILITPERTPHDIARASGIVIPTNVIISPEKVIGTPLGRGLVVLVGPEVKTVPAGSTVLYPQGSGQSWEGKLIVSEADVVGVSIDANQ